MFCEPSARVSDTRATNTQRTVSVMTLYLRVLWDFDVREMGKGNPIRRAESQFFSEPYRARAVILVIRTHGMLQNLVERITNDRTHLGDSVSPFTS